MAYGSPERLLRLTGIIENAIWRGRMSARDEVVLGADVTERARAKSNKGTAVLSVRLTTQELAKVDAASRATGRSVAQITREALAGYSTYLTQEPSITISARDYTVTS